MSTWIKVAVGVVLGFAGGFASGYLVHRKINNVEFEEIEEAEMAEIEEGLKKKEKGRDPVTDAIEQKADLPDDPDKMRMSLQGKVSYLHADQEAKERYAKIWGTVNGYSNKDNADQMPVEKEEYTDAPADLEDEFDEDFLEMIEEEEVEPGQVSPPHPIDLVAFYNERNEYDKITVDWYEPDVFLDEKEEVIADIKSYFGNIDIRKLFADNSDSEDPDTRFIRNEKYGTDYEIIRHHRTWSETVGGSE